MLLLLLESLAYAQDEAVVPASINDYINIITNLGGLGGFAWLIYTRVKEIGVEQKAGTEALRKEIKDEHALLRAEFERLREDSRVHGLEENELIKDFTTSVQKNGERLTVLMERKKQDSIGPQFTR